MQIKDCVIDKKITPLLETSQNNKHRELMENIPKTNEQVVIETTRGKRKQERTAV